jgi:hypothetical protein
MWEYTTTLSVFPKRRKKTSLSCSVIFQKTTKLSILVPNYFGKVLVKGDADAGKIRKNLKIRR